MKRFWTEVTIAHEDGGWGIRLDDRPLRTPKREPLAIPSERLAQQIADEWRAVEDKIDARAMPLTGIANAAIDHVEPGKAEFAAALARYAEADLTCYRATGPQELVTVQRTAWDALLAWARRRYDIDFTITEGITHVAQPAGTVERLTHAVSTLDAFHLAALSPIVTIGGSLVAALALLEQAITPQQAWDAVSIDDRWQLEQWGSDADAELALANRQRAFLGAAYFLELLDD